MSVLIVEVAIFEVIEAMRLVQELGEDSILDVADEGARLFFSKYMT